MPIKTIGSSIDEFRFFEDWLPVCHIGLEEVQAGKHECNSESVKVIYNSHVFERTVK